MVGPPLANKTRDPDPSLILDPVFFPGCHRGDFDDGRAKIVVTGLRSEVGTGTGTTSCIPVVWREGTRTLRVYRG